MNEKTVQFIRKARAIHGNRYDYSRTQYEKAHAPVDVICPEHGLFQPRATNHLSGTGCPECWKRKRRAASKHAASEAAASFVAKARAMHGPKYDYSKVDYRSTNRKVRISCPDHGSFSQTPAAHLRGQGCPACGREQRAKAKRENARNSFARRAAKVHENRYGYDRTSYTGSHNKVAIHCPDHGYFYQSATNHLQGQGCPFCGRTTRGKTRSARWRQDVIERFREVHDDRYDYSAGKPVDSVTPVTVICNRHGEFTVRASNHLMGHGCPECATEDSPQYIDARIQNDDEYAQRDGILYLLKVWHPLAPEPFYKVGITSLGGTDRRFGNRSIYSGFDFRTIDERSGAMRELWELEKRIKTRIKADKLRVEPFCDEFWHWTESFYSCADPTIDRLLA